MPQLTSPQGHSTSCGAFGDLVRRHRNEDVEPLDDPVFPSVIKVKLESLFDFSRQYWQKRAEHSDMTATLQEELDIWDVLDMDADGEPEIDDLETSGSGERGNQPDAFTSAVLGI